MNTHPEKWYIQLTPENHEEVKAWWLKQVEKSGWVGRQLYNSYAVLSKNPWDRSFYWSDGGPSFKKAFPSYQEITIEQFRAITNSTPKPMTKSIQISRYLLNEYYEASTDEQKAYLTEHFKLDGTTTDEAIRGLHELACGDWKPKIKANHPECFPEESKYFDFSEHTNQYGFDSIVSSHIAHSLGLCRDFIQVRSSATKNDCRAFYLTSEYNWELVKEGGAMTLIPTKKVK
jgi:hypothetical protein